VQTVDIKPTITTITGPGVTIREMTMPPIANQRRAARTAIERWAGSGIRILAEWDPDHATSRNDKGFSGADTRKGRSLASKLGIGLTDNEWALAVEIAKNHKKQIGDPPKEDT
jgi:hypothetical protein